MSKLIKGKRRFALIIPLVTFLAYISMFDCALPQSEGEYYEYALSEQEWSEPAPALNEPMPLISMDFQDANLKDVLKVFSQQALLNFIASENIKDRKVTLYLDKVSVADALDTILGANNLTYEQDEGSNIFVVKEMGKPEIETITKIYPLQYARVKGSELTKAGEETQTRIEIGIKEVIEELLTENGKIIEDSRTNSLIISDVPSQFAKIESAVAGLDIKLPQVMIEVEVIEASVELIDKLGIAWGTTTNGDLFSAFGAARTDSFPFTKFTSPDDVTITTGSISAVNLGGMLSMLAKDTNTKILARPRILTSNNETAEIKITTNTAISAEIQEVRSDEGLGQSITSPERVETGVTLEVTPQINEKGEITMSIAPAVINTKSSSIMASTLDPQTRSARTTVTVNNGETVVIGGLIDVADSKSMRKMPFFGDIPLLGSIFRKKDDSSTDKELIIFVTPYIVNETTPMADFGSRERSTDKYFDARLRNEAMDTILDKFEE